MKPYLDLFLLNTSAALLEMPENCENANKLFPKKHLKETVQAVTHLKKCKLKTVLEVLYCIVLYCIVLYCTVLYCIVLYCIQRKMHKGIWCNCVFTVSYRKQPKSRLFDFLKNVVTHPVISGGNKSSSVHQTG